MSINIKNKQATGTAPVPMQGDTKAKAASIDAKALSGAHGPQKSNSKEKAHAIDPVAEQASSKQINAAVFKTLETIPQYKGLNKKAQDADKALEHASPKDRPAAKENQVAAYKALHNAELDVLKKFGTGEVESGLTPEQNKSAARLGVVLDMASKKQPDAQASVLSTNGSFTLPRDGL